MCRFHRVKALALERDNTLECQIDNINLLPGQYWINVVAREVAGPVIDSVSYAHTFNMRADSEVFESMEHRGIVYLPARWALSG